MRNRFVLLITALASLCGATVLSDLAASMQPRTWKPVSTDLAYNMYNAGPVMDIIWAYGSQPSWDPKSRQLMFLGSPHNAESKFIIYDEAANHWRLETTCRDPQTSSSRFGHAYDMRTMDTDSGIYWIHTYNGPRYLFKYDPSANLWDSVTSSGTWDNTNMNSIAYWPDRKCIVSYSGSDGNVRQLNLANNAWSQIGNTGTSGSFESEIEYNARYHCMVMGGSDAGIVPIYMLDTNLAISRLTTPSFMIGCSNAELVCDPGSGDLVVFDGTKIHAFSMETRTWEDIALNPSAIANFGITGHTCIFGTIPEYNCHILLNGSSFNMLMYKHSAGGGSAAQKGRSLPPRTPEFSAAPNPSRYAVSLYASPGHLPVTELSILAMDGRKVGDLSSRARTAFASGRKVTWQATNSPPGFYIARLKAGGRTFSARFLLLN